MRLADFRYWKERKDAPKVVPTTAADAIKKLEKGLSSFFVNRQGRGHYCRVVHYPRGGNTYYFFAYLSDYAEEFEHFDESGALNAGTLRRAFEVVFAFDQNDGRLALNARGGRNVIEPLQAIFARTILERELQATDASARVYALDHLMDRTQAFPTDPEDRINDVSVKALRLSVVGDRRRRITLEVGPDHGQEAIHDMLDRDLDRRNLPRSILCVTKATLAFRFADGSKHRSMTFEVASPNSCSLKNKRDELRTLGEKYLRRWNIYVA